MLNPLASSSFVQSISLLSFSSFHSLNSIDLNLNISTTLVLLFSFHFLSFPFTFTYSQMATIVCQGLQSCLHDPHLVEPRTLRLRLSSPIPHHLFSTTTLESGFKPILSSQSNHIKELTHEEKCHHDKPVIANKNSDLGSTWSFLQALSSSQPQNPSTTVYHKPSSSITRLNQKSLELCTENLGNESGTIFIENDIFDLKDENLVKKDEKNQGRSLRGKKAARVHEFPPPLTTISGSESLQLRPHREEGRFLLKAVKSPLKHTCFQVERSNGCVKLSVSKDFHADPKFDLVRQTEASQEDNEANKEKENEGVEEHEEVEEIENIVLGEQEGRKVSLIEEMEEKGLKVEGEEGMDKFERLIRRCKEGSEQEKKRLIKFEPCNWVAT